MAPAAGAGFPPSGVRSNRAGNLVAISPDESPLRQFRAKYRGKAIFAFATWQMRNVLSRVTPNRAETPRGRARLFPASASRGDRHRLGAASSSSEQLDDRRRARVLPGRRLETSGMFAGASSPRCCSASARAPRGGATRGRGRASPRVPLRVWDDPRARARLAAGPRAAPGADAVSVAAPPDEQMARRARAREDAQASPRAPRRISDAGDARDARPHVERGDSRASPRFR